MARKPGAEGTGLTFHDLDGLDRKIIECLQENGRQSNTAIARALGVTEATVRNRVERLVSEGVIRITAVIDPRKTPYKVDAVIWIRVQRGKALQVGEWLAGLPNVLYVGHTTGRFDVIVEALFESDERLFEFLTTHLSRPLGIVQTETCHVLRTVKINYDWKFPLNGGLGTWPDRGGAPGAGREQAVRPARRRERGDASRPMRTTE